MSEQLRCQHHPALTPERCVVCGALWCTACCEGECPHCRDLDYTHAHGPEIYNDKEEQRREIMERRMRGEDI